MHNVQFLRELQSVLGHNTFWKPIKSVGVTEAEDAQIRLLWDFWLFCCTLLCPSPPCGVSDVFCQIRLNPHPLLWALGWVASGIGHLSEDRWPFNHPCPPKPEAPTVDLFLMCCDFQSPSFLISVLLGRWSPSVAKGRLQMPHIKTNAGRTS